MHPEYTSIVCSHSLDFWKTLISQKAKLIFLNFILLCFFGEHIRESQLLVCHQFVLQFMHFLLILKATKGATTPFWRITSPKKSLFLIYECLLSLDKLVVNSRSQCKKFSKSLWFFKVHSHIVFAKVNLNQLSSLEYEISSTCGQFGKPWKELLLRLAFDHSVQFA